MDEDSSDKLEQIITETQVYQTKVRNLVQAKNGHHYYQKNKNGIPSYLCFQSIT